jgi:phosphinothricin acetyltransferase
VTPPLVRDSTAADLPEIARIYQFHVTNGLGSFEEVAPGIDELARRRAEILGRGLPYVVAEGPDSGIMGYAYAGPYRTRSAYRYTVENSVYVTPGGARQGVGRRLLAVLIERCTALGYRQMVAVIGDSGNRNSIGLHEAMGFRTIGTMPAIGWKHGRWVDSVLMQRPLGPGGDRPPG